MTRIAHVVWDWNGTLLDDNSVMLASVNDVCAAYGSPSITMEQWQAALQRPLWACYGKVLGIELTEDDWPTVERIYHAAYRERLQQCDLTPDAAECLHWLSEKDVSQSVLSMGLHEDVTAQIAAAEIEHFFDAVAGIRSAVSGGSKAAHLRDHLRQLGLDPKEVLVIGDVVDDAHAAAAVGARVVLVCTGMTDRETLDATGEAVADTLMQALELHLGSFAHASVPARRIEQIEQVRCAR